MNSPAGVASRFGTRRKFPITPEAGNQVAGALRRHWGLSRWVSGGQADCTVVVWCIVALRGARMSGRGLCVLETAPTAMGHLVGLKLLGLAQHVPMWLVAPGVAQLSRGRNFHGDGRHGGVSCVRVVRCCGSRRLGHRGR